MLRQGGDLPEEPLVGLLDVHMVEDCTFFFRPCKVLKPEIPISYSNL